MKHSLLKKAQRATIFLIAALTLTLPSFAADSATPSPGDGMVLVMLISIGTTALMFLAMMLYAKIGGGKKK